MSQLIVTLSHSAGVRRLVQLLGLHKLGNWWLRHFPVVRRLSGSGVIYRATRLESIPLAVEMFEKGNLYEAALLPENFTTFVDLGCNVGYFTCWLIHLARGRKLRGLMLDANPEVVTEAQWHMQANQMPDVFVVNGVVGEGAPGDSAEFFLYESNICSMSRLPDSVAMKLPGRWKKIRVPCVGIEDDWRRRFGDARCHLLKVDVEGAEMNFLKAEQSFLRLVDSLVIEWHKWGATLEEIKSFLAERDFVYVKTIEEGEDMGTAFFRRLAR